MPELDNSMTNLPKAGRNYKKPLPEITSWDREFWDGCKLHELRLPKCRNCEHIWFPPYANCPQCLSTEIGWVKASGQGKVWSWIVMHQRYFESFEGELPYNVAFIQLREGPIMIANVIGCNNDQIYCDMRVEITFEDVMDDLALPKFRPVATALSS